MIIEVEGLVKHYGDVNAVDDVTFSVERGETFGLLGPNGAGKTTVMEILCGLRKFDRERVGVQGFNFQESLQGQSVNWVLPSGNTSV
jgi:ABC-2 type transport system ATP-binding protein